MLPRMGSSSVMNYGRLAVKTARSKSVCLSHNESLVPPSAGVEFGFGDPARNPAYELAMPFPLASPVLDQDRVYIALAVDNAYYRRLSRALTDSCQWRSLCCQQGRRKQLQYPGRQDKEGEVEAPDIVAAAVGGDCGELGKTSEDVTSHVLEAASVGPADGA
ncbi:hypothetical protein OG21DRAFT_1524314 [Imleria badia]|nr:hypothetical protein OG21DRAFT_1524314 [Imleria badia]